MNLVRGKLIGHARGFAFVVPDEKKTGDDDLFIPPTELNGALHGDTVLARLSSQSSGSRQEGSIVRILERGTKRTSWYIYRVQNFGFVIPDNKRWTSDIFVLKSASMGAVEGHKVVVKLRATQRIV